MESRGSMTLRVFLPVLLGLAGVLLVLLATTADGPGVSSDAAYYLSVARNLADGQGFLRMDGEPVSAWPPLYPMILSLAQLSGGDVLEWARWLNALLYGLIVLTGMRWLAGRLASRFMAVWAGLLFLFAYPLLKTAWFVWTEPFFCLFTFLFLTRLAERGQAPRGRDMIMLILLAALAWFSRYLGVILVATGFLAFLFASEGGWKRRLGRALTFSIPASLPTGLWLLRNMLITGAPAGERSPSSLGILDNFGLVWSNLAGWFMPGRLGDLISGLALLLLILILAALALRNSGRLRGQGRAISVFALFIAAYSAFLIASASRYDCEPINSRYLVPVFLPLLALMLLALDAFWQRLRRPAPRWGLALIMILWLLFPVSQSLLFLKEADTTGTRFDELPPWKAYVYSGEIWRDAELMRQLRQSPPDGELLSNFPEAVFLHAGLKVRRSPRRTIYSTGYLPTQDMDRLGELLATGQPVTLAWFTLRERGNNHSLDEISARYPLEELQSFADGALYRVEAPAER